MSTRVRTDGRRYNRETDLPPRPYHKPEPGEAPRNYWQCQVCGAPWTWVDSTKTNARFRRHFPGTFWEQD